MVQSYITKPIKILEICTLLYFYTIVVEHWKYLMLTIILFLDKLIHVELSSVFSFESTWELYHIIKLSKFYFYWKLAERHYGPFNIWIFVHKSNMEIFMVELCFWWNDLVKTWHISKTCFSLLILKSLYFDLDFDSWFQEMLKYSTHIVKAPNVVYAPDDRI